MLNGWRVLSATVSAAAPPPALLRSRHRLCPAPSPALLRPAAVFGAGPISTPATSSPACSTRSWSPRWRRR